MRFFKNYGMEINLFNVRSHVQNTFQWKHLQVLHFIKIKKKIAILRQKSEIQMYNRLQQDLHHLLIGIKQAK